MILPARLFLAILAASLLMACVTSGSPVPPEIPQRDLAQPTGGKCGGIAGFSCASKEDYCAMPAGSCRIADGMGTCTEVRPFCTREYRPVCGCDGKTYGNACTAAAARVNVDYAGPCRDQGGR